MLSKLDQPLLIDGPAGDLEAVLRVPENPVADVAAVVCHPHPLHGGTMDNKVVTTLVRTFYELGIPALRFNFRGVGHSQGKHDHGHGEIDDLTCCVNWLKGELGVARIVLAGFSFGSGVVSNACLTLPDVIHAVFVAPPVGRYNFSDTERYPCPDTVVMGEKDDLVDAGEVRQWAERLNPPGCLISLPEADHFFHGQLVLFRQLLVARFGDALKSVDPDINHADPD